ncbi:MAG: N-acetylmuramoyl-L-alanine amidase [Actinobacteria bacterium]|nr:MAG: N-acetylmuramoyl-L-alanine amidase [Actinomycetota bacterium]
MIRRFIPLVITCLALSGCDAITGADLTTTTPPVTETTPAGETSTTTASPNSTPGLAIVPTGGASLFAAPAGEPLQSVHEGLILPVLSTEGPWLEVMDSCSNVAWVSESQMQVVPRANPQSPGTGFDLSQSVVIVDAGHGGRDWGAPGPDGTRESFFNLDIADRLRDLLLTSHDVDWATGRITPGETYSAIGGAYMTRDTEGPDEGDFEAGLAYRAAMANSVGADALLSIHNNTGTDRTLQDPPRAVFYALTVEGSDRLASLIDEELFRSFDPFASEWQGSAIQGTASRMDVETGGDFYGLLRRSAVPAVIIEGVYVTDPTQNTLLQTTVFRQAYAEGVYRGLIRFLTTDEVGSVINEPVPFEGNVGSPSTSSCVVPEQP